MKILLFASKIENPLLNCKINSGGKSEYSRIGCIFHLTGAEGFLECRMSNRKIVDDILYSVSCFLVYYIMIMIENL